MPVDGLVLPAVNGVLSDPASYGGPVVHPQVQLWEAAMAVQNLDAAQMIEQILDLVSLDLPPIDHPTSTPLTSLLRQLRYLAAVFGPFVSDIVREFEEDMSPGWPKREHKKLGFVRTRSKPGNLGPLRGRLEVLIQLITIRMQELGVPLIDGGTAPRELRPRVGKSALDAFPLPVVPEGCWNP
jgi:hypothetical protein